MRESGVKFGTSGARGLVTSMTDRVCHAYTTGFLQYLRTTGALGSGRVEVAVGGDLRPSTGRIMAAVCQAVEDFGGRPLDGGRVPSPALAAYAFARRIPSIMVTGSHIPDDRNGIKFNQPDGELLKSDEPGMTGQVVTLPPDRFAPDGSLIPGRPPDATTLASEVNAFYLARYFQAFPGRPLEGLRVGVYQHSAVGRDVIAQALRGLGAQVSELGRSEIFVPVDTEAIREEDVEAARRWASGHEYDALVSADGDSDRPLVSDEHGEWLRGDVAGILCAGFLRANSVVTPVSSNTAVEKCGWFAEVRRTRIGSPFVVAEMLRAAASGATRVVGYEANGGFLVHSDLELEGGTCLPALPTRDALIVILAVLLSARLRRVSISQLTALLPPRFTASGRLESFAVERSQRILRLLAGPDVDPAAALHSAFASVTGSTVSGIDRTDGLRVTWHNGEILHLRPSGNAPEFRCYTEAASAPRAESLCAASLKILPSLSL
ncbi:MAG: phosphomannomutase [Verrucomicrobiales bacterium]|nr:phosphomannomutase [Verrucomicrobiales bacterium]